MIRSSKQGRINDDAKSNYKPFIQSKLVTSEYLQSAYEKEGHKKTDADITKIKNAYHLLYEITYQMWAKNRINKNNS